MTANTNWATALEWLKEGKVLTLPNLPPELAIK